MLDYVELFVVCCKRDVLDRFLLKNMLLAHATLQTCLMASAMLRCQPNVVMYDMPEDDSDMDMTRVKGSAVIATHPTLSGRQRKARLAS